MIKWPRKSHRRRAREGQRERATRTSTSKETFIVDATFRRSRSSAATVRDTRVVQIRCWDESTHVKVATLCTHRSHGARAGALNASPTRHDAQTVIKKYVYNPGRVTFAHFCARVRRRRS